MSRDIPNATLHQQDGSMTAQAFADQEGLSLKQVLTAARRGQLLGARQNPLSKRWWVYPPAKLLSRPRSYAKRSSAAGFDFGTSPHGLSVVLAKPHQETPEALSLLPPAKPVLTLPDSDVYRCPETQSVLRTLREAAARQCREGIHYLRLEGRELSQLYAALDHERSRIRKLVGKGLVDMSNLRASDSAWQKLQAMCQQGKLL